MVIKREVDGKELEFTLAKNEMTDAFYEMQHKWDKEYILNMIEMYDDLDDEDYVKMAERLRTDDELLDRVAYRYRKYMGDLENGEAEYECMIDAYEYMTQE